MIPRDERQMRLALPLMQVPLCTSFKGQENSHGNAIMPDVSRQTIVSSSQTRIIPFGIWHGGKELILVKAP